MRISHFTAGKNDQANEDSFGYTKTAFTVVDGVTDKSGKRYGGKTGGEIISKFILEKCLTAEKTGPALINYLNAAVADLYKKINPKAIKDSAYRFGCTLACARIKGGNLVITQVNDTAFRINGKKVYQPKDMLVDTLYSKFRSDYIKLTRDIAGSREFLLPLLKTQHRYQNDPRSRLGFGVVDGTKTPTKFIRTFKFPLWKVRTLEIFTDGYFAVPKSAAIKSWEDMHKTVEREDPHKYLKYKSTKSKDDRTVLIVNFKPGS